jgi:hypothetical protein
MRRKLCFTNRYLDYSAPHAPRTPPASPHTPLYLSHTPLPSLTAHHTSLTPHCRPSAEMRRKLRFTNRYLGYVCVVDGAGVVRWHVHSSEIPTQQQIEALRRCLR